ncbi:MAG: hypothetical protein KJ621_04205, partial [Proteobacteria bacterium]|nr:hypothetical protein [Pseudomonadota bacterium]
EYLQKEFGIGPRDAAFVVPKKDSGINVEEDWKLWTQEEKDAWHSQISITIVRWAKHINLPLLPSGFRIPNGYEFLKNNLEDFFTDNPDYQRNIFIMMRLDNNVKYLREIYDQLLDILRSVGLNGLRADDRNYLQDRNLWNNVCVYMIGCKYGIAVLEDRKKDEFNPNVAMEYGFMRALNKPTLLLVDEGFRNLRADILGTLWEKFDITDISATMRDPVIKWLSENCPLVNV